MKSQFCVSDGDFVFEDGAGGSSGSPTGVQHMVEGGGPDDDEEDQGAAGPSTLSDSDEEADSAEDTFSTTYARLVLFHCTMLFIH